MMPELGRYTRYTSKTNSVIQSFEKIKKVLRKRRSITWVTCKIWFENIKYDATDGIPDKEKK